MRAIAFDEFGGPEVLAVREVPVPEPTGARVRVAVRSAGVNPLDWKIRSGASMFTKRAFPIVLGLEIAGVVDAVGPDVTDVRVGDEVFGSSDGGYAEYALSEVYTRKPAGLSWPDAVALPVAVTTAARVLALLDCKPGETLLVNGAAGAMGAMGVQLATADGVTVLGTASAANQELVAALGAAPTTYGTGVIERVRALAPQGVDAVFDAAGHGFLSAAIELRAGKDRIVTIADPAAFELGIPFSTAADDRGPQPTALWHTVAERVVAGTLRLPAPAREFPLAEAAAAHRESESGHGVGKIVLIP